MKHNGIYLFHHLPFWNEMFEKNAYENKESKQNENTHTRVDMHAIGGIDSMQQFLLELLTQNPKKSFKSSLV